MKADYEVKENGWYVNSATGGINIFCLLLFPDLQSFLVAHVINETSVKLSAGPAFLLG